MAAEPRPRIKRHEAERLGRGRVDNFPDVHIHAQAELLKLVDQGDVDAAENIFQELGHFRGAGRADSHDASHHLGVERLSGAAAGGIQTADDLGDLRQTKLLVARILALRRKSEVEIANHVLVFLARSNRAAQAAFFQDGQDQLFGGSRIGGGFQHNELSFLQMGINGKSGLLDVTQIGLTSLVERRGHTNDDGVGLF